jgi:hypothetical protein
VGRRYTPIGASDSAIAQPANAMWDSAASSRCCREPVAFRICLVSPVIPRRQAQVISQNPTTGQLQRPERTPAPSFRVARQPATTGKRFATRRSLSGTSHPRRLRPLVDRLAAARHTFRQRDLTVTCVAGVAICQQCRRCRDSKMTRMLGQHKRRVNHHPFFIVKEK